MEPEGRGVLVRSITFLLKGPGPEDQVPHAKGGISCLAAGQLTPAGLPEHRGPPAGGQGSRLVAGPGGRAAERLPRGSRNAGKGGGKAFARVL